MMIIFLVGIHHEARYWADELRIRKPDYRIVTEPHQLYGHHTGIVRFVGRWWLLPNAYEIAQEAYRNELVVQGGPDLQQRITQN